MKDLKTSPFEEGWTELGMFRVEKKIFREDMVHK